MQPRLSQRLHQYSEKPPHSVWEAIETSLKETKPHFSEKLYAFEAAPPAGAWEGIAQNLNTEKAKIVPLRTKLFKYAIAASLLFAIATGAFYFIRHTDAPGLAAPQQNATKNAEQNGVAASSESNEPTTQSFQNNTSPSGTYRAKNRSADYSNLHYARAINIEDDADLSAQIAQIQPSKKRWINTELADRYMIATTADGDAVRIPKKAYSDYACTNQRNSAECKERLAELQHQMAAAINTDFTGMVDLLNKLEER